MGAIGPNDFPPQANGYGQPSGDHVSPRTDRDDTERLTVTTDQKVITEASDSFLHHELNASRALPVKHEDRQVPGLTPPPTRCNPADVAAAEAALDAMGVRVRTSQARRRADVVTPGVVAAPTPP